MPEPCAGHSKNCVFWAELVNSGSPVPAGCTWAAAGWARATAHATAPKQISRVRMGRNGPSAGHTRHSGLPANRKRVLRRKSGGYPPGLRLVEEALLDQPRALLGRHLDVARREQEDLVG